ncbi:MAG: o-succinylbenzoate synthase [Actinobacteria bacterium]|nr:o-succinylbenzoate synthase [Actinomycetota bacterium]
MDNAKLSGFDLYRYELPFSEPLTLKGRLLRRREGLLLELTGEGGVAGWGEASPLPGFSREGLDETAAQLRDLASSMMGREITDDWMDPDGSFSRELDAMGLARSVRFGLELALWNLYGAARGRSLAELITPRPRTMVPVNALISDPPDRAIEEAHRVRSAGYEAVKLKVGGRAVEEDIDLVRALSEELGDAVALRLDANRAWSLDEAERFARGTAGLRFEYVEEPLADPAQLPSFARTCGVPVALDESLAGMEPEALEDHGYARAIVLKPTLVGGISRTLRFAALASRLGMEPVISSAYETGVGTAALVDLAAAVGNEEIPAGLDTYRRLADDVLRPRLDLPAPRVDVRAVARTRHGIDLRLLTPVG